MELAKQYYGTDEITPEMYENSKQKTFAMLYGIGDDSYGIPLFEQVRSIKHSLWNKSQMYEVATLPTGKVISTSGLTDNKLFNYHVQSLEVFQTIPKIQNLFYAINNKNSKVVLYTYDGILLDVPPDELDYILSEIPSILEEGGFPVRAYVGENYGNMSEINVVPRT